MSPTLQRSLNRMVRPPLSWAVSAILVTIVLVRIVPLVMMVELPSGREARDFVQEYLLGKAVLIGVNPYLPQPQLAALVFPEATDSVLEHPVPHPPLVALLSVPLALLPYRAAALVWLAVGLASAAIVVVLIGRAHGTPLAAIALAFALVLIWLPVRTELLYGQLNLPLAALLVAVWAMARSGKDRAAGALLALASAIKVYPVLLVGCFLLQRRWRLVAWSGGTFVAFAAAAAACLGPEAVATYLSSGLPSTRPYVLAGGNLSLAGAMLRITLSSGQISPLVDLGRWSYLLAALVMAGAVVWGARLLHLSRSLDLGYALALCLMLAVQPLTWFYYLVIVLLPLWFLWERGAYLPVLVVLALTSMAPGLLAYLGLWLARTIGGGATSVPLPTIAGLPSLLQSVSPLLLAWALGREIERDLRVPAAQ